MLVLVLARACWCAPAADWRAPLHNCAKAYPMCLMMCFSWITPVLLQLKSVGSRPLIFSQWTAVLDIMEVRGGVQGGCGCAVVLT